MPPPLYVIGRRASTGVPPHPHGMVPPPGLEFSRCRAPARPRVCAAAPPCRPPLARGRDPAAATTGGRGDPRQRDHHHTTGGGETRDPTTTIPQGGAGGRHHPPGGRGTPDQHPIIYVYIYIKIIKQNHKNHKKNRTNHNTS